MENDFDQQEKMAMLEFKGRCWKCGSRRFVSLHHILKRVSNSKLNGFALCNTCHDNVTHSKEERQFFIKIAFKYVLIVFEGVLKKRDKLFVLQNPDYYSFLLNDKIKRET